MIFSIAVVQSVVTTVGDNFRQQMGFVAKIQLTGFLGTFFLQFFVTSPVHVWLLLFASNATIFLPTGIACASQQPWQFGRGKQ